MNTADIAASIAQSKKYKALYRPTIERVVNDCVDAHGSVAAAEDAARTILHQIWGSYYPVRPNFKKLWDKFQAAVQADGREQAIEMVLRLHASSAERLPFFNEFYKKIFALTGTPSSIVDHGCCLNPIAFERMIASVLVSSEAPEPKPHADSSEYLGMTIPFLTSSPPSVIPKPRDLHLSRINYRAFDIDVEEVAFLQQACALLGYGDEVQVATGDVIADEAVPANVVFMLKLLPVLEQQQKGSAREMLLKQRAKWLVVSYPVASLSGKEKGMIEFYTNQFLDMVDGLEWEIHKLIFPTELVFVVDTKPADLI